jgi:hypothetical protein
MKAVKTLRLQISNSKDTRCEIVVGAPFFQIDAIYITVLNF